MCSYYAFQENREEGKGIRKKIIMIQGKIKMLSLIVKNAYKKQGEHKNR